MCIRDRLRQLANKPDVKVVITTDHGSIRCLHGVKALGDRETSTNLRYKCGRNVKAELRNALFIKDPVEYKLPKRSGIVNYIIAKEDFYFVYPTDCLLYTSVNKVELHIIFLNELFLYKFV